MEAVTCAVAKQRRRPNELRRHFRHTTALSMPYSVTRPTPNTFLPSETGAPRYAIRSAWSYRAYTLSQRYWELRSIFCPRYETRSSTVPEIAARTVCLFNGLFACSDTFLPYGVQYNSYRLLSIRGTVKNVLQFDITHKINDTSKICILLFNIITLNSKTFMKMFFDASQIEFLLHALLVCLISLSSL